MTTRRKRAPRAAAPATAKVGRAKDKSARTRTPAAAPPDARPTRENPHRSVSRVERDDGTAIDVTRLEWWEPDGAHMIREEESLVPTPSADRIAKMREDFADLLRILAPAWIAIGNARPVERPGEDLVVSEVASARYRSEQDDPVFIDAETLRDLLKLDDELWHASGDGRAFRARHRTESGLLPMPSPTDGATWAMLILHVGSRALHDVAREIAATPNLATLGQETTGWIADAVATGIRRELLRLVLRWNGGNLARVSDFVRAGGSGSVSKLLRKLDLGNAYLEHRQQGAGKPGPKRRSD